MLYKRAPCQVGITQQFSLGFSDNIYQVFKVVLSFQTDMFASHTHLPLWGVLAGLFLQSPLCTANPKCTYLEIPITAKANNKVFPIPTNLDYNNPGAISALIQTVLGDAGAVYPPIATTFNGIVAARFCEPQVKVASRANTVQLFMSGVTENNLYWFGLGYPNGISGDKYSTVDYASKQGYPTLAIDRAGVGNSTHPDPVVELQVDLEEAISHALVNKLRAGTAVPGIPFFVHYVHP